MSIKQDKPIAEELRVKFIMQYGQQQDYTIYETDSYIIALEPWEYMDGDEVISRKKKWDKEQLVLAKEEKCKKASDIAFEQLGNGTITYEFREDAHIEATDGNIGKFGNYVLGFITGTYTEDTTLPWVSKEDTLLSLNRDEIQTILKGMGAMQTEVWTVKYPYYLKIINACTTVEEVNEIVIDYTFILPVEEEEPQTEEEE